MYRYSVYGLVVRSALPLPELPEAAPAVGHGGVGSEVLVHLGPVAPRPGTQTPGGFGFWASGDEACHYLENVGAFLARGGHEIVVDPAPGVDDRVLRLSILGPALALILHQRGLLVLHASVVARDGDAVAFLGDNGWGKSYLFTGSTA
jgi:hypothetical protein